MVCSLGFFFYLSHDPTKICKEARNLEIPMDTDKKRKSRRGEQSLFFLAKQKTKKRASEQDRRLLDITSLLQTNITEKKMASYQPMLLSGEPRYSILMKL